MDPAYLYLDDSHYDLIYCIAVSIFAQMCLCTQQKVLSSCLLLYMLHLRAFCTQTP